MQISNAIMKDSINALQEFSRKGTISIYILIIHIDIDIQSKYIYIPKSEIQQLRAIRGKGKSINFMTNKKT